MTRQLAVITAGLSQPSASRLLADRLAAATADALERRGTPVDIHLVEVRDLAHDIVNNLVTGFPSAPLKAALDAVGGADGVIAVAPTFRASFSGLFKSFIDVLDEDALAGKPVLLGATGGSGRHSLVLEHALRPVFTYMRAVVVPTSVFAATDDWATSDRTSSDRTSSDRASSDRASSDPASSDRTGRDRLSGDGVGSGGLASGGFANGDLDSGGLDSAAAGGDTIVDGSIQRVGAAASLRTRIDRAASELAVEIGRRDPVEPADPFALTTSFDRLLSGD